MSFTYSDLQITEGDQFLTYSKEGLKGLRKFMVDDADNGDPQGTLFAIMQSGQTDPTDPMALPFRGAPHPSINISNAWSDYMGFNTAFCCDIVTIKAISPTQAMVECEYCIFNAVLQEVSVPDGTVSDQAPALLTVASSVQTSKTQNDAVGNILQAPYSSRASGPEGGPQYLIYPYQGARPIDIIVPNPGTTGPGGGDPFIPGSPSYKISADAQIPNTVYRFQRRESIPRGPDGLVGMVNAVAWEINLVNYDPFVILCTRIESVTDDNGLSWLVTYEFQVGVESPTPEQAKFVPPADESSPGNISPWLVGTYYTLPNGYLGKHKPLMTPDGQALSIQQGAIPFDANPWLFQIYGQIDFNGALKLTP